MTASLDKRSQALAFAAHHLHDTSKFSLCHWCTMARYHARSCSAGCSNVADGLTNKPARRLMLLMASSQQPWRAAGCCHARQALCDESCSWR